MISIEIVCILQFKEIPIEMARVLTLITVIETV